MRPIATAMAMLALSAAPAALAQPYPSGQPYPQSQPNAPSAPYQYYQGQGYPPASDQPPYADDQNQREAQQYDRSEDAYEQQMRQYQHDRRQYDRQRDAYDAQFGAEDANAYAPSPPDGSWRGYYRYSDTVPFRDGPWESGDRGGRWFRDRGCRLAVPYDDPDPGSGNVIPVCPDVDGHYRPAD